MLGISDQREYIFYFLSCSNIIANKYKRNKQISRRIEDVKYYIAAKVKQSLDEVKARVSV